MGILSFFRSRNNKNEDSKSASVAKERLQVLISHERTNRDGPEYLPDLKQDLIDVIKKYVNVGEEHVMVKLDTQDNFDVLELNITLPEVPEVSKDTKSVDAKDSDNKDSDNKTKTTTDAQKNDKKKNKQNGASSGNNKKRKRRK